MLKDFFLLGTVTKHFGYKGEVFVYLDTDEPEKYNQLESVFFMIDEEPIPFFIDSFHYKEHQIAIVKFKDIDYEESKSLISLNFYLPISMLPKLEGNCFYYHEVKGFTVIDKVKGNIGICHDFIDYNSYTIMQVMLENKEILIPVADQFFTFVDRDKHILYIDAPEGLIDIYLN